MRTRKPAVAGQFYPGEHDQCLAEISEFAKREITAPLPDTIVAGIVPHAGWTFSGQLAVMAISAIKQRHEKVDTFVIFGAVHRHFGVKPAVYDEGVWVTPLGQIAIDEDLAGKVLSKADALVDVDAHQHEHSIEVQIPLVQHFFPNARILPILVPPTECALPLGDAVGEIIATEAGKKIVCLGSTDLTHYGPRYGFTPMGIASDGYKWANDVNDRQFIDLALKLEPEELLNNANENCNACGPGAAAATVAAAKKLGKTEGVLLAHTNSNEVMLEKMEMTNTDTVGYAAIVF